MMRIQRTQGDIYRKIDLLHRADNNKRPLLDDKCDRWLQLHHIRTIGIPVPRLNSSIQPIQDKKNNSGYFRKHILFIPSTRPSLQLFVWLKDKKKSFLFLFWRLFMTDG